MRAWETRLSLAAGLAPRHRMRRYFAGMARTLDPNGVVDDFVARLVATKARTDVACAAIPSGASGRLALQRGLVSDLAFRMGGEWELFQHRWHIAVISKEPARFVGTLQGQLDQAVDGLPGHGLVAALGTFKPTYPSRLRSDQIEALLDGDGYNITFPTLDTWRRQAGKHFTPTYAGRVARLVDETPED